MLPEVEPMSTEVVIGVVLEVGESVVMGFDIEVLIMGADVGNPVLLRLVITTPVVCGTRVLKCGRICAVPELAELVMTETFGETEEVLTGAK